MTYERIKRLTELARRVWPDEPVIDVIADAEGVSVESGRGSLCTVEHEHALDAMEAALLVLADDDVGEAALFSSGRRFEQAMRKCRGEPPAWAKKLADEWYASAKKIPEMMDPTIGKLVARILGDCASELLKRARERGGHE